MTTRILTMAAVAAVVSTLGASQSPDRMVTVSGSAVRIRCAGTREANQPLVVLEAGAGQGVNNWQAVQTSVAAFARVCSYDRPGSGDSQPYPAGFRAVDHASLVRAILQAAGEPPPYVLVGHSLGGIVTSLYAMAFPADIKGMVLVDSSHEDQERRMLPITGPPPPRKIPATAPPGVPPPPPPGLRFEDFAAELRKTPFRGDVPLVVLTATRPPLSKDPVEIALQPLWLELHRDLASRSPRSAHVLLPNSGHLVPRDDPQAIADAIRKVLVW
jgi:pimeloyl-ACP methyl ester carboxylesterase